MPVLESNQSRYPRVYVAGKRLCIHRLVAEAKLGRKLQADEIVHHLNGIVSDNRPENLLVCTQAEHCRMHQRERALAACGNADYYKCAYCKAYDDPKNMKPSRKAFYHSKCKYEATRIRA